jgi:hypothetical protein
MSKRYKMRCHALENYRTIFWIGSKFLGKCKFQSKKYSLINYE